MDHLMKYVATLLHSYITIANSFLQARSVRNWLIILFLKMSMEEGNGGGMKGLAMLL
jgi:hypothetical protein